MQPDSSLALSDQDAEGPEGDETSQSGARRHAFRVERRADGRLWVVDATGEAPVELSRCFPWTEGGRHLSLRTSDGKERAFVADPAELDAKSRDVVTAALARAGFVLDIVRVLAVEEEFELRSFAVETAQGPRRFQTPLDGWPRELEDGSLVIEDVYGDLYRVRDLTRLDPKSRKLLSAFIG